MKLEDFAGERGKYRGWRSVVKAQQQLYRLEQTELAMLIYLSSIASYLSQIKRLRADYQREDPGTVFSDRAWAQRLLMKASLTKRERLDVFFSAGGVYSSKEVEKALRHRYQRIHEERRLPPILSRPTTRSAHPSIPGLSLQPSEALCATNTKPRTKVDFI